MLRPDWLSLGLVLLSLATGSCGSKNAPAARPDLDAGGHQNAGGGGADGGTGVGSAPGPNGGTGNAAPAGVPRIGAHGLSYYRYDENELPSIDLPALATQPSGSTLVVAVGRGDLSAFRFPTDNKGNAPYTQLGSPHPYTHWQSSGTALYAFSGASGGPDHVVRSTNEPGDEITLAVVEVIDSSHVQDFQWVERLEGQSITSGSVTTTGPATLVALWWGDGGASGDKVAVPDNGFAVLDSIGDEGSLVQCFVAAKEVAEAGTYDVTWEATPPQGAQLWLVAVQ